MSTVTIYYEAKCKHCRNCKTISRKTYCTLAVAQPKTSGKVEREGKRITQKDRPCIEFQL